MRPRTSEIEAIFPIPCLALPLLLSLAGCFTAPSPDLANLKCTTDQQCPSGYSCLAPNQVGGCCKGTPCPVTVTVDGSNPDFSPVDLGMTSEAQVSTGNSDGGDTLHDAGGTLPIDAPTGIDQGTGGSGEMLDAIGSGGSGGSTTLATDGASAGGAGGSAQLDASVSDSPADLPARDVATEESTIDVPAEAPIDAPGTCSLDKDCPAITPLCLANKCAKCTTDTDCVGRTGPACETSSGLCVACTTNKYCTGTAAVCNTTTNQCTGCVTRSDCAGSCQTCASGVCSSVKNQDDPGVCAGTCDSTGACKAKQGQTCQATADCAGGLPCADGRCCNSACTGSCEACDITGSVGTCMAMAANAQPHSGHPACTGSGTCAGYCNGDRTCYYPHTTCNSWHCNGDLNYFPAVTCNNGSCGAPTSTPCASGTYCSSSSGACVPLGQPLNPCTNNDKCASNNCTSGLCCDAGLTNCNGACVNTVNDSAHCGSCPSVCPTGTTCSSSQCFILNGYSCSSNFSCYNGNCCNGICANQVWNYGATCTFACPLCPSQTAAGHVDCTGACVADVPITCYDCGD